MRDANVRSVSDSGLAVDATIGSHLVRFDEPMSTPGGTDTGAAPTEMLLAALGACEAITLKMYAARKGWALRDVRVQLSGGTVEGAFVIRRHLDIQGDLDAEQLTRLRDIVNRCPVQRIITGEVRVEDAEPVVADAAL